MNNLYSLALSILFSVSLNAAGFNLHNPRSLQNWESYAIVGDAGVRNDTTEMLRKDILANKLTQLIVPGDNLYVPTQTYAYVWDIWKKDGFLFPLVAIGNHNSGYGNEVAYFQMPAEYYYKESKGALFIVLNSDNESTATQQIAWLDKVLSQSNYALNFLIYHHPTINVAMHQWDKKKTFQLGMRQVLKKHAKKITSLIVGHDHLAGIYTLNEVPMVISGASWESRKVKLPPPKDDQIDVRGLWATISGGFWWTRLDYNSVTKEAYVHFNRFDKAQSVCTFRLTPKPISKSRGCQ